MSSPASHTAGLETLYERQNCTAGGAWNPVVQDVPMAHVGPHLVVACLIHRDTLVWYFSWTERVLWLISSRD